MSTSLEPGSSSNTWALVALAIVASASACKEKSGGSGAAPKPVAPPIDAAASATAAQSADGIVELAYQTAVKPYVVTAIRLQYVRADGMLDPTYGKASVDFGYHLEVPGDDPKRPIGAPVVDKPPPAPPDTCPAIGYETGKLAKTSLQGAMCFEREGIPTKPVCTIAKLWQRAIADGAPANALATFELHPPDDRPLEWDITIDDEPRNYHFAKSYRDEQCGEVPVTPLPAEAGSAADIVITKPAVTPADAKTGPPSIPPDDCDKVGCFGANLDHPCCEGKRGWKKPSAPGDSDVPEAPTAADIRAAVNVVKSAIVKCGEKSPDVHGRVKLKTKVKPDGTAETVTVEETPDPALGNCASRAMKKLKTLRTKTGLTFTMPFNF